MRCWYILLCLLVTGFVSSQVQAQESDLNMARGDLIEDLLIQYYKEHNFNGGLLVALQDVVIYQNTFGFADLDTQVPLDQATPFYLASLGKQFTATAIMKLVEEGKISLEDPVRLYFPKLPEYYTRVKIYHLLNHTSGIADYLGSAQVEEGMSNQQVYAYLLDQENLAFKPGSKYRYNNSGYVLLAMIIEMVSGKSISNYFVENFFAPLEMTNTFIYTNDDRYRKRARGFSAKGKLDDYYLLTVGDGGFYSTTEDLYIWLQALNNEELISGASLRQMYAPVNLAGGKEKRYGFGWELGVNAAGPLVYHSGELAGFRTYMERHQKTGATIIILTNTSFSRIADLRNALVKILDGRLTRISEN